MPPPRHAVHMRRVLFYGVLASLTLLVVGTVAGALNDHVLRLSDLMKTTPSMLTAFWHYVTLGDWACVIAGMGALLLISLPMARAVLTAVRFIEDGDRLYEYATYAVIVVLSLGFVVPLLIHIVPKLTHV